jgi:hypothetical protein
VNPDTKHCQRYNIKIVNLYRFPPFFSRTAAAWEKNFFSCTDKKEKKIFLIYKEIQMGAVAKSFTRKNFLIYEEMRKYLFIYEEVVSNVSPRADLEDINS